MRATKISSCLFVQTPSSKVFVLDGNGNPVDIDTSALTEREATAFIAMQDAYNMTISKVGKFEYENFICPWDFGDNNAVTAQNGLFVFPAAIITAEYPDGSAKRYVLGKDFVDKLTGGIWTAAKIYPYIRALVEGKTQQQTRESLICTLVPPLCEASNWVWFALALGTTVKAYSSKPVGRAVWGTAAFLVWKGWYERGGLEQLKETVGK